MVASGVYDFVGLGSAAVIEPSLLKDTLLTGLTRRYRDCASVYRTRSVASEMDSGEGYRQWVGDSVLLLKYEKVRQWAEK